MALLPIIFLGLFFIGGGAFYMFGARRVRDKHATAFSNSKLGRVPLLRVFQHLLFARHYVTSHRIMGGFFIVLGVLIIVGALTGILVPAQ